MQIILLEKVHNLGNLGEVVQVANGYARNFLLPQKKAMRVTAAAKAEVDERRQQLAQQESNRQQAAQARADLCVREISVTRLAGEGGKLYGSVSPGDIAETMRAADCNIEKSEIFLPSGPIKQLGEFSADIILHAEVRFAVKIKVLEQPGDDSAAAASDAVAVEAEPNPTAESAAKPAPNPTAESADD